MRPLNACALSRALQGYKEAARNNILLLADSHKWQLLQSYQLEQAKQAGDIREQPEHWINVVNIEPSVENLQTLAVLIRQKPVVWVQEFIELNGVTAVSAKRYGLISPH